jgi:hypothetical protein
MPILGTVASSRLGSPAGGYVSLATFTCVGAETSVDFTSINQSYQHLEIRYVARGGSSGASYNDIFMQMNGVTSANYSDMYQGGDGGTLFAGGGTTGLTRMRAGLQTQNGLTAGIFGCGLIRIPNYTSTTSYKIQRAECGWSSTGQTGTLIQFGGGLWVNTNAVTSLSLIPGDGSWIAGSTFSLYGIK